MSARLSDDGSAYSPRVPIGARNEGGRRRRDSGYNDCKEVYVETGMIGKVECVEGGGEAGHDDRGMTTTGGLLGMRRRDGQRVQ